VNAARATTVLVVDDDGDWRAALEHWLQGEGMRGVGLGRGEWITSAIEAHRPDVVLLDIHLPGLDGLQTLELLRLRWPSLPVVMMTAFGGVETGELARRCGATGYLEKPFRMAELMTELARVVEGSPRRSIGEKRGR
jgi:two-component system nitrogen regulation response regulator NtrX